MSKNILKITAILCSLTVIPGVVLASYSDYTGPTATKTTKGERTIDVYYGETGSVADGVTITTGGSVYGAKGEVYKSTNTYYENGSARPTTTTNVSVYNNETETYKDVAVTPDGEGSASYTVYTNGAETKSGTATKTTDSSGNTTITTLGGGKATKDADGSKSIYNAQTGGSATKVVDGDTTTVKVQYDGKQPKTVDIGNKSKTVDSGNKSKTVVTKNGDGTATVSYGENDGAVSTADVTETTNAGGHMDTVTVTKDGVTNTYSKPATKKRSR